MTDPLDQVNTKVEKLRERFNTHVKSHTEELSSLRDLVHQGTTGTENRVDAFEQRLQNLNEELNLKIDDHKSEALETIRDVKDNQKRSETKIKEEMDIQRNVIQRGIHDKNSQIKKIEDNLAEEMMKLQLQIRENYEMIDLNRRRYETELDAFESKIKLVKVPVESNQRAMEEQRELCQKLEDSNKEIDILNRKIMKMTRDEETHYRQLQEK